MKKRILESMVMRLLLTRVKLQKAFTKEAQHWKEQAEHWEKEYHAEHERHHRDTAYNVELCYMRAQEIEKQKQRAEKAEKELLDCRCSDGKCGGCLDCLLIQARQACEKADDELTTLNGQYEELQRRLWKTEAELIKAQEKGVERDFDLLHQWKQRAEKAEKALEELSTLNCKLALERNLRAEKAEKELKEARQALGTAWLRKEE